MERGKGHRFFGFFSGKQAGTLLHHRRLPYQKLVQDGDSFCVNDEKQKMTFENYLRTYLKEHPDSNESDLPIVSGAMGYISYDYGRGERKL